MAEGVTWPPMGKCGGAFPSWTRMGTGMLPSRCGREFHHRLRTRRSRGTRRSPRSSSDAGKRARHDADGPAPTMITSTARASMPLLTQRRRRRAFSPTDATMTARRTPDNGCAAAQPNARPRSEGPASLPPFHSWRRSHPLDSGLMTLDGACPAVSQNPSGEGCQFP